MNKMYRVVEEYTNLKTGETNIKRKEIYLCVWDIY